MSLRRSKGFTLVELMVTIAVLAVLVAIAFPSFRGVMRNNQVASANNEVLGLFSLARSEGLRNNRGAGVCASTSGSACDGSWGDGLMAYSDLDGDGSFGGGDTVLRFVQIRPALTVTSAASASSGFIFDSRGRSRATANQSITITPSACKTGEPRRTLTVNLSGQVRVLQDTCS